MLIYVNLCKWSIKITLFRRRKRVLHHCRKTCGRERWTGDSGAWPARQLDRRPAPQWRPRRRRPRRRLPPPRPEPLLQRTASGSRLWSRQSPVARCTRSVWNFFRKFNLIWIFLKVDPIVDVSGITVLMTATSKFAYKFFVNRSPLSQILLYRFMNFN